MNQKIPRYQYVLGDIQGCHSALEQLLISIDFDPEQDKLWFVGDLVARGEDSLAVLRTVKKLHEQGCAVTVLGNHDINLIAVWRGFSKLNPKDKTQNIFEADDVNELMDWLRKQPLAHCIDTKHVLCHAGIPHIWTTEQAINYAREVQQVLSQDIVSLDSFLLHLYGKYPDIWTDELVGYERIRCITNYLTRMRLCTEEGQLEFSFKEHPKKDADDVPTGFQPWYKWKNQITKNRQEKILFGHWAALKAKVDNNNVRSLDAGCVWGGKMLAYRINDGKIFTV